MRNESFVTFIVVAIILLVVIFSAFSIVGPTERGIKVTLGVADEEVLGPGLKIKAPFFQKMLRSPSLIRECQKDHRRAQRARERYRWESRRT